MVPDLTLEVIYYQQSTDFKMEFALCGCCNVRFLSMSAKDRTGFLTALGKSVARSRAIVTVGSFNPLDSEYLPKVVARAVGYTLKAADKTEFAIEEPGEFPLPITSIPLVTIDGKLGGCVLESSDQSIIMLTADRELRHRLISDLVCPYLQIFAGKKGEAQTAEQSVQPTLKQPGDRENEAAPQPSLEQESDAAAVPPSVKAAPEPPAVGQEPVHPFAGESAADPDAAGNANPSGEQAEQSLQKPELLSDSVNGQAQSVPSSVASGDKGPSTVINQPSRDAAAPAEPPRYTVLEEPEHAFVQKTDLQDFLCPEQPENGSGKRHRRGLRAVISIVLVAAVLLSAYFGYEWVYQPMQNTAVYKSMRELYGQVWDGLPSDMLYKFGKLYQTNRDVFGWLSIPDTAINYPVVSSAEKSAAYYQTHLFEGSVNRFGTLYTPCPTGEDSYVRNITVYGKSLKSGTGLAELANYLQIEQYRAAPSFTFDTVYLENKWKIFSVFQVKAENRGKYIQTEFFDDQAFSEYLSLLQSVSVIETGIDLRSDDQLITLICEEKDSDVVVVARRVREGESPLIDVTESSVNENALPPDAASDSAIPADAAPIQLQEISDPRTGASSDSGMGDGTSSRFEQRPPASSAVDIKPTNPTVSSSSRPSSKPSSSGLSSSSISSATSSGASSGTTTSSGGQTVALPILTVTNSFNGQRVSGPANEIVAKILEAEMGSGYHIEALKAQAVAAYSWLLCNGASSGSAPQAPMKTPGARATEAADAVAGVVAVYNGKIAQTYYYAISAGRTANCQDIWTASLPYLVSVDSSVDKNVSGFQTIRKYASSDVARWAQESLGVNLNAISNKNSWFRCVYDENGLYVKTVSVGGVSKKGTYLRDSFFTSARVGAGNVLRSSAYTITYSESEDKFIFTVKGYGHGVGMSQTGANAYAKSGMNYEAILKHYYQGITLGTYLG